MMKIDERTKIAAILSILAIGFYAISITHHSGVQPTTQGIKYVNYATVQKYDSRAGLWESPETSKFDPLTNQGGNAIKGMFNGTGFYKITNITLANCTAAFTLDDGILCSGTAGNEYPSFGTAGMGSCGLGPVINGTYTSSATVAGAWNYTYQWTSGCDNIVINATALYNETHADGQLLISELNFTSVTLQTGDKINVTWGMQVSLPSP